MRRIKIFCVMLVVCLAMPFELSAQLTSMPTLSRTAKALENLSVAGRLSGHLVGVATILTAEDALAILLADPVRREEMLRVLQTEDETLAIEVRRALAEITVQDFLQELASLDSNTVKRVTDLDFTDFAKRIDTAQEEARVPTMISILQEKVETLERELRAAKELSAKDRTEPFLRYNPVEDTMIFRPVKLPGVEVEGFEIKDVRDKLKALWLKAKPWLYGGTGGAVLIGGPPPERIEGETEDMIAKVTDKVFRSVEVHVVPPLEEGRISPERLQEAKELLTRPLREALEQVAADQMRRRATFGQESQPP